MSERQSTILNILSTGPASTQTLAHHVGYQEGSDSIPAASVRRDIQALRKQGHNIVCHQGLFRWNSSDIQARA